MARVEWTRKRRVVEAMRGGTPDRVPVCPGISEGVPVRLSGLNYIEFFLKERVPLWKARIEAGVEHFGADGYIHVGWGDGPHDPETEETVRSETPDEVVYDTVIHTSAGDLRRTASVGVNHTVSTLVPFVKDPDGDAEKVLCLLKRPDEKDFSECAEAYAWVADRGMVGLWVSTPIDWWTVLRGGPQAMILDLVDRPDTLRRLFGAYTEFMTALVEHAVETAPMDSVGLGGSCTSMSVISPALHREHSLPFGKAVVDVCRRRDMPTQYHMCGRSRAALEITAEMGVSGFDALECPPTGDVDLAEVKRTFGARCSLKGNVNSITVMRNGTPEDVARDVERCLESAKAGGGYLCSVGDQCPAETPDENLFALVETVKRLGGYG